MLHPSYLQGGQALVHLGDLIYVSTRPGRDRLDGREVGETRVALVMVGGFARGDAALRLVQDFGRPEDGARDAADDARAAAAGEPSTAAAPKRGRGLPPGRKSKPKAAWGESGRGPSSRVRQSGRATVGRGAMMSTGAGHLAGSQRSPAVRPSCRDLIISVPIAAFGRRWGVDSGAGVRSRWVDGDARRPPAAKGPLRAGAIPAGAAPLGQLWPVDHDGRQQTEG